MYVTSPPGARHTLVVVERYGRIRLVVRGRTQRRLLADLRPRVRIDDRDEEVDQRGLFSIAFPPDYRRSHRFYVDYVDRAGTSASTSCAAAPAHRRVLDLGPVGTQHHGGQLQFGPDGRLYVSTGMDTARATPDRCYGSTRGAGPRSRRSTRPDCATRGASRSTARPARC